MKLVGTVYDCYVEIKNTRFNQPIPDIQSFINAISKEFDHLNYMERKLFQNQLLLFEYVVATIIIRYVLQNMNSST